MVVVVNFNYFTKSIFTYPSSDKEPCAYPNSKNDHTYCH